MLLRTLRSNLCCRSAATDGRLAVQTRIFLFLLGILLISAFIAVGAQAKKQPTYRSLGDHTETVQVDFDPTVISYQELLDVFWASHIPGFRSWSRQYQNVVFYHNDEQKQMAEESKARVAAKTGGEVHTAILPATEFTLAEDYHQKYYLRQVPGLWRELSRIYPDLPSLVNSTVAARMNGYVAGYGSVSQLEEELPGLGLSPDAGRQLLSRVAAKTGKAQGCPVPR
ncbi:MAG: peptide-methionine (S)-S-oxide reductase [Syntrophobacterales bacterium]